MPPSTDTASDHPRLFISYARADDEAFAKRLWWNLEQHGFRVWWDREKMESRGQTFLQEIRDAINASDRVLLIVGPNVRQSRYVEVEWRHALRGCVVVTPVLRMGDYENVPEALRSLHCVDVRPSIPESEALEKVRRIVSTPIPPLGALVGVPRLPTPYHERAEQLDQLRLRVLIDAYQPVDLQPDQRITCLTGMGGVGKSVLAAALAQAPEVRRSFQDGVYWITTGRDASTLGILARAGLAIGDDAIDRYTGVPEARLLLGRALANKNCLLVLDDVWNVDVAEALHTAAGKNVRILITSRKRKLFASAGVQEVSVEELSTDQALDLLADWTQTPREELPPEASEIAQECGNLPLALTMIGAMIRGHPDRWGHALERLRRADLSKIERKLPDYQYETLDRAMLVSFEDLDLDRQQRYLDLVVIPEDAAAPASMLQAWWIHEGMDRLDVTDLLDDLVDRSLLRLDQNQAYFLHDVQHDFLIMRTVNEQELHSSWLAAFAALTPRGWATAEDDGYLFDHLAYHLRRAGREHEWRQLLISFAWLERKAGARGFPAVLQDLAGYSSDNVIGSLHRVCRRAAHVLTNDTSQLAAQLLARIDGMPGLESLLEEARAWHGTTWLRPVTASLSEEGEPILVVFRGREEDGHAGTPRSIALSTDGSLIVSGGGSSNDLAVKVWSTGTGILLRTYDQAVEIGGNRGLSFIGTEGRFAGASRNEVCIYSLDTDIPIARRAFDGANISCICASEHNTVFIGFEDGCVLAWNLTADIVSSLRDPAGERVINLAHAAAATRLVIATASKIECRESEGGSLIGQVEEAWGDQGFQFQSPLLVITPDGSKVFFGSPPRAWTVGESASRMLMETIAVGRVISLNEDGTIALVAANDREIITIETATGKQTSRVRNSREFSCMSLARNGNLIATADFEHDVKLWDLRAARAEPSDWENRGYVNSAAISDDQGLAFIASENCYEIWDMATGRPFEEQGKITPDQLMRRGNSLVDRQVEGNLRAQLKGVPGSERRKMGVFEKAVTRLRDGLGEARAVTNEGMSIPFNDYPIGALAVSQTARRVVSATNIRGKGPDMEEMPYDQNGRADYPLSLWSLGNIKERRLLHGHTMPIMCVDMTLDGKRALTGSTGRLLRLWDLDEGVCLQILRGHRGIVFGCTLSEDARFAVSGSEDMTVRLWDLVQGKLLFTFAVSSAVTSCDISRDGSVAIAAESSGRIHTFALVEQSV